MSDDALDPRTVQELRVYAEGVIRPIDAMTIAEIAIAGRPRRRVSRTTMVLVAAALVLALAAAVAVGVATRPTITHLTTYRGVLVAAPDLLVPRRQPLLVPLADGRVLIAGGDAATTTTAEIFHPASGRPTRAGAMVSADNLQVSAGVLLRDGRVLLIGDAAGVAVAQLFDPATMRFAAAGPMVTPRAGAKLALLGDGRVLMAGGTTPTDPNTDLAAAELFDPATATFSATGSMITKRWLHSMTTLADGRVLVTGGYTADGDAGHTLDTAEIYDPATASFTTAGATAQISFRNLGVLLPDGRVVLIGQRNGSLLERTTTGPAAAFDPVARTFTGLATLPRSPGTATLLDDGRIFLTGSWTTGNWSGIYDPVSGHITDTGTTGGWEPSAARLADGRVLVVGGFEDGRLHGEGGSEAPPVSSIQIFE